MTALADRLDAAPAVRAVRAALAGAGAAEAAWLVGGTVRDALLGRPLTDVDVAVAGDPERAARAVAERVGGPAFPMSAAVGTWRAIDRRGGWVCDVARLQGETIHEDLAHRDFTINAMALPLLDARVADRHEGGTLDPHGGRADLEAGVLRVLGGPELERSSYAEDSLRPLRCARLATELALRPEPVTERLTREGAPRVTEASPERVFSELRRILVAERVLEGLALADRLGLVAAVLPEVAALHGVEQSGFHHLDAFDHTVEVVAQQLRLEARPEEAFGPLAPRARAVLDEPLADELTRGQALRLAALLHDVGKPATRAVRPDGRVTFVGHDAVGEEMVHGICRRLHTSTRLRTFLAATTRHHLRLGFLVHQRPLSRRAIYRYLCACQPVEVEVTVLSCADRLATRGRNAEPAIAAHLELARELLGHALAWRAEGPPKPPVRGDELARALGAPPGPRLGRLLAALAEARYAGEVETREQAVDLARRLSENDGS